MDTIEKSLECVLDGKAVEDETEYCDFTLSDQAKSQVSRGVTPSAPQSFVPRAKKTVSYIVAAVLVNEQNEVLMMQEAKSECAGQWYLPAGRMELGESIEEAVKREVFEETGLTFECTTLLMVESASGVWYRFVFTGNITGGKLKTVADADSESLQAKWVDDVSELSLRCNDILPLIMKARKYHKRDEPWHEPLMPAEFPHTRLLFRLIICAKRRQSSNTHVLVSESTAAHLPTCEIDPSRNLHSTLKKYMTEVFGSELPPHWPHGILSLEYSGKEESKGGMCLTLLVSVRKPLEDVHPIDTYTWLEMNEALGRRLLDKLPKSLTVPLNVIR